MSSSWSKTPKSKENRSGITDFHWYVTDSWQDVDSIEYGILSSAKSLYLSSEGAKIFHPGVNLPELRYDDPNTVGPNGNDVAAMVSWGPYDLKKDSSITIIIALVAGKDYNELIQYWNSANEVVNKYQNSFFNKKSKWENSEIKENDIEILSFYLEKNGHILCDNVKEGDNLEVIIDFAIKNIYKDLTIGISLFDSHGRNIYRTLHTDIDEKINNFQKLGKNTLRAKLNTDILLSGTYNVVLDASRHNSTWIVNPYEEKEIVLTFYKDQSQNLSTLHSSQSIVNPITEWKLNF